MIGSAEKTTPEAEQSEFISLELLKQVSDKLLERTKRPPAESRWVSFATESRLYRLKPAKKSTG